MIREYKEKDIVFIEQIGQVINKNYKFKTNPYTTCFVYEQDDKIIGFVIFAIMYEKAEIIDIAVSEEAQRKSIGTKLLTTALKECSSNNCESVTLEVRNSNKKAISFYKKMGFRELSTRKSYYYDGEDALLMIKMVM
ncbi:MAG TPA: ribosomal protein S18-alanine N-acetyltransferase [Mollicutes bacterium]|nr:ribosomal protein S18-alanine N-acetyltransferase [Mollicutes bacterium]